MMKKIVIILVVIALLVIGFIVYLTNTKSTHKVAPIEVMKTISGTTYIESGTTQNENEWNPKVMRTGPAIQAATGVTVTISTNGPAVRSMTAEELVEFQKKAQGK